MISPGVERAVRVPRVLTDPQDLRFFLIERDVFAIDTHEAIGFLRDVDDHLRRLLGRLVAAVARQDRGDALVVPLVDPVGGLGADRRLAYGPDPLRRRWHRD